MPTKKTSAAQQLSYSKQPPALPSSFPPGSFDLSLSYQHNPIPSTEEHSEFLQQEGSAAIISNLEDEAENTTTTNEPSQSLGNRPIPISPQSGPLSDLNNPPQKKRKRCLQPNDNTDPLPQPFDEMMKKSILELTKEAQENSKRAMSEVDRQYFLDYHIKQRQMLIIKAIEQGVSMPMVDGFIGKQVALKDPNCWNQFFKSKEAREVFRAGNGINNKEARVKVSAIWRQKTKEEKRSYVDASAKASNAGQQDGNINTAVENNMVNGTSTASNVEASSSPNPVSTLETPHLRSTVSFRNDADAVAAHMDKWLHQATRIAARYSAQFILFGVSNHVGPHSFQYTQSTPGATPFLQFSLDADQKKHYPARFQSYITGHTECELAALSTPKKKRRVKNGMSVTDRMHRLIDEKTMGVLRTWPWTNTKARLADIGYKLVLTPNARINSSFITQSSRFLSGPKVQILHLDIEDQLIDLVRIPRVPLPKRSQAGRNSSPDSNATHEGPNTDTQGNIVNPNNNSPESEENGDDLACSGQ